MNRSLVLAALMTSAGLVSLAVAPAYRVNALPAPTTRTIYISATNAAGAPVTDLTAKDVTIKEDGKVREVTSLALATDPLDISILVDDHGGGAYQGAVLEILQTLMERARYSISLLNPQADKILDFTNDFDLLQGALNKVGRRGAIAVDDEQLVEAIANAVRDLQRRNAVRPAIVMFTLGGDGGARNPDLVMTQLRRSGASLHVIYLTADKIGQVLGDGPRETGGLSERIGSANAIAPAARKIANTLKSQYALKYVLPDGVKLSDRVSVATSRQGVTLLAPSRIPDR
jgi:hypothetical protein